jgi:hypothetical protein
VNGGGGGGVVVHWLGFALKNAAEADR